MVSNDKLEEKYSEIPEGTDILISHDSPTINNLGLIQEGWNEGVDAGNIVLDKYIRERKPRYFFSGHIHSGNHNFEDVNVNEGVGDEEIIVKMEGKEIKVYAYIINELFKNVKREENLELEIEEYNIEIQNKEFNPMQHIINQQERYLNMSLDFDLKDSW